MNVNKLYDAIIIGYNDDTKCLLKNCPIAEAHKSYAIISKKDFDCEYQINKFIGEVILLRYNHGLINVYLRDGQTIFGKNLVLSIGTCPRTLKFDAENIYYNINFKEASIEVADRCAIIVGDSKEALKNSLAIAKSAKEVYVCASNIAALSEYDKLTNRLKNKPDNIHLLINSEITEVLKDKANCINQVILSTYNKIDCDLVIGYLGTIPDMQSFLNNYVTVDSDKKIIVTDAGQTGPLPNVYAIGECTNYKDKNQKNDNIIKIAKTLKGE